MGKYIFCMFVQGTVFIILTLVVEYRLWACLVCTKRNDVSDDDSLDIDDLDEDVLEERKRVLKTSNTDVLQVKNLFKR